MGSAGAGAILGNHSVSFQLPVVVAGRSGGDGEFGGGEVSISGLPDGGILLSPALALQAAGIDGEVFATQSVCRMVAARNWFAAKAAVPRADPELFHREAGAGVCGGDAVRSGAAAHRFLQCQRSAPALRQVEGEQIVQ